MIFSTSYLIIDFLSQIIQKSFSQRKSRFDSSSNFVCSTQEIAQDLACIIEDRTFSIKFSETRIVSASRIAVARSSVPIFLHKKQALFLKYFKFTKLILVDMECYMAKPRP